MKTTEEIIKSMRICADETQNCAWCAYKNSKPCMRMMLNDAAAELNKKATLLNIANCEIERLKENGGKIDVLG